MKQMTKKELWVFDIAGKRKYELDEKLITRILFLMKGLYFEWVIDFMRDVANTEEWNKVLFIAIIDGEPHDLKRLNENEGISFMKSLLRDIKINNIIYANKTN
jgi:hypothetical protein